MEQQLQELKMRLREVTNIQKALEVLAWDQATYMPAGGAQARGEQMSTLSQIGQEKFTAPEIGRLLDDLAAYGESLPYDADDAALIRVTRRQYERAVKVPTEFVGRLSAHSAEAYQVWSEARPANDFKRVLPYLEKTLDLSRELAEFFAPYDHIADPLIDGADYGMKAATIRTLFAELREELVPIVRAITSQPVADDSCLRRHYATEKQLAFALDVATKFGYDLNRGRQDLTHHPFMISFSVGDVRITTRTKENFLGEALFSTLHEAGHALYEQGINPDLDGSPLGGGTSAGVHESQSRLWENTVGRSRGFWEHFYPALQATFPDSLGDVALDTFYRAVNKVAPSLIRTDADEVTYNLHVMIRFDLELQMLEGELAVRDLPDAWHARYQSDLGLHAPDDKDGALQDVHWYVGLIGGSFQGYTLGNIFNAQYYAAALKAHPEIPSEIGQGKFDTLHTFLKENLYWHGSKFTADELTQRITGGPISIAPYIAYLRGKYGDLYQL